MRNAAFIFVVLVADIWGSHAQGSTDLLCANVNCPDGKTCGVLKKCDGAGCPLEAVCLSEGQFSSGCPWGEALVEPYTGSLDVDSQPPYQIVSCGTRKHCPDGFFCSTMLMDTFSRCCPSRAGAGPKPGNCPAIKSIDDSIFFCVDQCLSDTDCSWDQKCCVTSEECPKKKCKPPV